MTQGVYKYKATTMLDGTMETSTGQFTVKALEIEAINTTADFGLLRTIAKQTNGKFHLASDAATLQQYLLDNKPPELIHSQEEFVELMNQYWIIIILLLLATFEWFMRKFKGGY